MAQELSGRQATGEPLGIDLGIKSLAVCSDGQTYANPRALERASKQLARCQRELSRRQKGSGNRAKSKAKAEQEMRISRRNLF